MLVDTLVLLAIAALTLFLYLRNRKRSKFPFPPGPKKLPLLGNLLDLPTTFEWQTYARWAKECNSDIIHLTAAGSDIIVLNSLEAANELFDRRSSKYSSRPQLIMIHELSGWGWVMSLMPYGDSWRSKRKLFTKYFHPSNEAAHQPMLTEFVHRMMVQLLDTPEDFLTITQHTIGGMAISLAYGLDIKPRNDPYVAVAEEAIHDVAQAAIPGTYLVEVIPWLKYVPEWFPGAGFKQKAKHFYELNTRFKDTPFNDVKKKMATGSVRPSFTSVSLESVGDIDINAKAVQEELIKDTAGMVFAAGSDTTLAGVQTMILALIMYPDVLPKAQNELDKVLRGRLPTLDDIEDIPYISALVKEVLRWQPVTPIAIPHLASEDDVYDGYFIPKGAIVIGNAWSMLYDEKAYPESSSFRPERFLTEDGKLDPKVQDPSVAAFGFGRRVCAGKHIAISTMWLVAATLLSSFTISPDTDEKNGSDDLNAKYESGLIFHPKPFKCNIKPRSAAAERLIRSTADLY